jgi:hypothetical protein
MMVSSFAGGALSPFVHPEGTAAWCAAHPLEGPIFNADRYGGYLIWKLYPLKKVYIDTRLIIRPRSFFSRYLAIVDTPAVFDRFAEETGVSHVALPVGVIDRYLPLARHLYLSSAWRLVFADGAEVLFVRDTLATTGPILIDRGTVADSLRQRFSERWGASSPLYREALIRYRNFLFSMGEKEIARQL